ncbi:ribonuclease M5 [Pontibacillus halophilus JSM 076056 = DSM 19796]|uniref:Ribonuclease M5 n=1 Tax=Pontibacillus halophilus JSM 076056 = DSM 19796 TaxID=1385510 RepID=A0A0A5I2L8_9BACI|nr:ribonuclease M5 [Pontibacillus halophilus]KGX90092.1 ribonuclease M5 [Pontibacillus halophilus JSM 076056 = DSM 19796]
MKIKEVIVVEGRDDTVNVHRAVDADTIETNGSAVNHTVLEQIKHAQEKRGVIIFTDPDYPGERIRHIITQAVPGCKHAFLPRKEALAKGKGSLGVEHASPEAVREALQSVYEMTETYETDITREDLVIFGLNGGAKAKDRRQKLGSKLKIGYTNGKQLYKRLSMFEITRGEFIKAMDEILQEEIVE